jgi:malate dehydrogenase (oxaloacetate-decarboxylating)(NADP+)
MIWPNFMTAKTVKMFGVEPVMAMVSFSNFGSSTDPSASKVRGCSLFTRTTQKWLSMEVQADFALNPEMLKEKFPFSKLAGKSQYFDFSES